MEGLEICHVIADSIVFLFVFLDAGGGGAGIVDGVIVWFTNDFTPDLVVQAMLQKINQKLLNMTCFRKVSI